MSKPYSKEKFLKEVADELHDAKQKWKLIGTQLEVPQSKLKAIEQKHKDELELALIETINEWLNQILDGDPSWSGIIGALQSRSVDEHRLARNLKLRKCKNSSPQADDDDEPGEDYQSAGQSVVQGNKVSAEVAEGIKRLAKHFNSLRIKTFRYIKELQDEQRVTLDDFRVFVCNPEHLLVYQDHRELRRAKSTSDICTILSQKQYLNWQHYDILEEIIKEYGDPCLKKELEIFLKEIKSFEEETELNDVINIVFTPLGPNLYLTKLLIPEEVENPTMETVRKFKNGLKKMNGFSSPVHHIEKNSPFSIYFIMPRLFFSPTFMTETSIGVESDEIEGCTVIKLSEQCVRKLLNLPTNKPSKMDNSPLPNPQDPQDVNVDLEDDIFPSMERRMTPHPTCRVSSASHKQQVQMSDRPILRSVSSSVSHSSTSSGQSESFPPIDPSCMQVHHDKVLMNGDSAVVCKAQFLNLPCAAKYIHPKLVESSWWQAENFKKGCKILQDCRHPNIVTFLGIYSDLMLKQPILFMELMDKSLKFLDEMKVVPLHLQVDICIDVAQGLEYLHAKNIIHGNLTATNVLVEGGRAKIGGSVMTLQLNRSDEQHSLCPGTPGVLPRRSFSCADYDEAIDCFSFGVLGIHIATKEPPTLRMRESESIEMKRYEESLEKLKGKEHPLCSLIIKCLNDVDSQRPSATKLCQELASMIKTSDYRSSKPEEHISTGLQIERIQELSEENEALKRELKCANDMHQKEKKDLNDRINFLDEKLKAAIKQLEETEKEKNEAQSRSKAMYAKLNQMQKQNGDTPEKSDKFATV